ncbi:MAG TPA: hypothetical protein DGZ34_08160 [Lachnospiraceae bacterium]|nr:hypothetical protein DW981_00865 [Clostridium sp. AM49-4BH]HCX92628.1 hypothetical protein [Lachnospiraceae bacterium]
MILYNKWVHNTSKIGILQRFVKCQILADFCVFCMFFTKIHKKFKKILVNLFMLLYNHLTKTI